MMAVIRQRRQNIARQIGVIRADTGEQAAWRSVGEFADTIIESSFNELKRAAKKEGVETAQAASAASLRAIDPKTGMPSAFQIPENFGIAAQEAYEDVIERRYVSQTEQDFKQKASELAIKYEFDPDGVAKFTSEFGTYIESTSKNALPKFANIIQNVGQTLLASNKLALTRDAAIRERQSLIDQLDFDVQNDAQNISALSSLTTPQNTTDIQAASDIELLYNNRIETINEAVDNNLINSITAKRHKKNLDIALFQGTASRIIRKLGANEDTSSVTVNQIRNVIQRSGNGIDNLPKNVQEDVMFLVQHPAFLDLQNQLQQDLSAFQVNLSNAEQAERLRLNEEEREEAENERLVAEENRYNATDFIEESQSEIQTQLFANDFVAAKKSYDKFERELRDKYLDQGLSLDSINSRLKSTRNQMIRIMAKDANDIANTAEMVDFANYIEEGGTVETQLSPQLKTIADNILSILKPDDFVSINNINQGYVSQKRSNDNANQESQSTIEHQNKIDSGLGTSTNSKQTKIIHSGLSFMFGFDELNYTWYTSDEGFSQINQWSSIVKRTNVVPEPLINAVNNLISGQQMPQDPRRVLDIYATFANVRTVDGEDSINMWQDVISFEDRSLLEAAIYASALLPEGQVNIPDIISEIRDFRSNEPEMRRRTKNILGNQSISDFTEALVLDDPYLGADKANPNVISEIQPLVEYFVAANMDKKKIKENVKRIYEQHYPETDGIVIDPSFGPNIYRSAQSLRAAFPNKRNRSIALTILNEELSKAGLGEYAFRTSYTDDAYEDFKISYKYAEETPIDKAERKTIGKKRAYLLPRKMSGTAAENIQYMVMYQDDMGMLQPLIAQQDIEGGPQSMPVLIEFGLDKLRNAVSEKLQ